MSLLTISQAISDETKGARVSSIINNADPAAQNHLRIITKAGNWMMKSYGWQLLRKEHAFTAPGVETLLAVGAVPADFDRFVPETFWDRASNNLISGPVGAVEWQGLKVQQFSSQNKKFAYRGGAVLTQPILDSGAACAFEYIAKRWIDIAATGTPKAAFTLDTDIGIIDEELLIYAGAFEYLDAEGQPAARIAKQLLDYYNLLVDNEVAEGGATAVADIFALNARHFEGSPKASRASYGGDF